MLTYDYTLSGGFCFRSYHIVIEIMLSKFQVVEKFPTRQCYIIGINASLFVLYTISESNFNQEINFNQRLTFLAKSMQALHAQKTACYISDSQTFLFEGIFRYYKQPRAKTVLL